MVEMKILLPSVTYEWLDQQAAKYGHGNVNDYAALLIEALHIQSAKKEREVKQNANDENN